jgi:hypothetical protein
VLHIAAAHSRPASLMIISSEVQSTMTARITINLKESEAELKKMIKNLQDKSDRLNPYHNRSESEIAKMILKKALPEEHERYTKDVR